MGYALLAGAVAAVIALAYVQRTRRLRQVGRRSPPLGLLFGSGHLAMLHRRIERVAVLMTIVEARCDGGPIGSSVSECRAVASSAADQLVALAETPRTSAAVHAMVRDVQDLELVAREIVSEVDARAVHRGLSSEIRDLNERFALGIEAVRDVQG